MAHFRGEMAGNRGETTRQGSKQSGMVAHIHGWNFGVNVRIYVDPQTGEDTVALSLTGGTNGMRRIFDLGTFSLDAGTGKIHTSECFYPRTACEPK